MFQIGAFPVMHLSFVCSRFHVPDCCEILIHSLQRILVVFVMGNTSGGPLSPYSSDIVRI